MHGVLIFFDFFVSFSLFLCEIIEQFNSNSDFFFIKNTKRKKQKQRPTPFLLRKLRVCVCASSKIILHSVYPPLYVLLLPVDVHVLFSFHSFCYNNVVKMRKDQQ
jgi:hypothetical protein